MSSSVVNYDGSIHAAPQQLVYPQTVAEIQDILRNNAQYPSPVRAVGSYHSLTPCASSDGTMVNMTHMKKVLRVDDAAGTFTAEAGLQVIEASRALRQQNLQLMTNIEIGNMTLGSASCCHSKDALDGVEFGQFNSYVTSMKWVTPSGELAEASEESNPELLRRMRSSYGLCGIVYEVTLRVKPVEALHFTYTPIKVDELTQQEVDEMLHSAEGTVCWTVGRTCTFQQRQRVKDKGLLASLFGAARRRLWNHTAAHAAHFVGQFIHDKRLRELAQTAADDVTERLYERLSMLGGITMLAPDKTVDYSHTAPNARYAFTFWAFPRERWLETMRAYLDFAEDHHRRTGFRCNMPLGSYFIRTDQHALLSYTHDGEVFSIDPIHASTDDAAWHNFLVEFNDFAFQRQGIPLLNQSPFVERKHVEAAFGDRWFDWSDWVKAEDPAGRMMNPFFAALISSRPAVSTQQRSTTT